MCNICILLDKDKITTKEAKADTWEQMQTAKTEEEEEHIRLLYKMLDQYSTD